MTPNNRHRTRNRHRRHPRTRAIPVRRVFVEGGRAAATAAARAEGYVTGTMRCTRRECLGSHHAAVLPENVHAWAECASCRFISCEFTPHPDQPGIP